MPDGPLDLLLELQYADNLYHGGLLTLVDTASTRPFDSPSGFLAIVAFDFGTKGPLVIASDSHAVCFRLGLRQGSTVSRTQDIEGAFVSQPLSTLALL
ncbi:hypothetical protein E4U54_001533 [Claviceps lovelessii]|nr:hypothetical protein E4U54_001533 [Claviceps lovelessii]